MNTTLKHRRKNEHTKIKLLIGTILAAILLLYLVNVGISSTNIQGSVNVDDKGYILISVNPNDSLWAIANTYMNDKFYDHEAYILEVMAINHLDDTIIIAGEQLLVPIILD